MIEQREIQKLLNEKLLEGRLKNSSYSIRALANKLQMSPSSLSEILNAKRRVSQKLARRIIEKLCLDPKEANRILKLFPKTGKNGAKPSGVSREMLMVDMDHFRIISDWYHFAIQSLSETEDFKDDPIWIAGRLNINVRDATAALSRLERLGFLVRNSSGRLVHSGPQYTTSDDVVNLSLRKSHAQNLELAKASLENDPVDVRDFTAITMAIDPARLPEAKQMIREFRDRLCDYLESGTKKEVYKLCIQTIPLTKSIQKAKGKVN